MRRRAGSALLGCALLGGGLLAGGLLGGGPAGSIAPPAVPAKSDKPRPEQWRESGPVVRVIDGDTFDMTVDGERTRVRINGIQAPEMKWCGGRTAKRALKALLPPGTEVRLASVKAASGNAPTGTWRLKRTVHVLRDGQWVDIAPEMLSKGLVFPFPFIGEDAHNNEYLKLGWQASRTQSGLYDPAACGPSKSPSKSVTDQLKLEVVADGPGPSDGNSEFVMVFNGSDRDIDLSGWMVQDTSPLNAFFFPKRAKVRADDYVVVLSGDGQQGVAPNGRADERYFYAGTGMRWNNDTADIAFLFDDAGRDQTGNLREWLILTPGS